MKLTIDRNQLAEAVTAVAPGLPARPQHPLHAGVLVTSEGEICQFTASDGETVLNAMTDAETETDGSFVFPRVFTEIAKSLPGEQVEITVNSVDVATVKAGKTLFTFPVLPGRDYPFPSLELPVIGEVDGPEFRMALRKVLPAVDASSGIPFKTVVRMEAGIAMQLVATDDSMAAAADCDIDYDDGSSGEYILMISGRVAEKVARMDGVNMTLCSDGNRVQARSGGFSITCRNMDVKYPRWDKMLSMGTQWTKLPPETLDAVKRAAITLSEKEPVFLQLLPDELVIGSNGSKGTVIDRLPWEHDGPELELNLGFHMLSQALSWCDEISAEQGRPLLLRGPGCRYLVQVRREID